MFYEPALRNHGLKFDPFKALVAPRPIGWISSLSPDGKVNLAPYSYFNAVASRPPLVLFSSEGDKDSTKNIRQTGEFCCSIVGLELAQQMNQTSAALPHGMSEFGFSGLTPAPSRLVKPPHVREARAALECRLLDIIQPVTLEGTKADNFIVLGQVVGIHVDDTIIEDGRVRADKLKPLSRLGYNDYAAVEQVFEMIRPDYKGG